MLLVPGKYSASPTPGDKKHEPWKFKYNTFRDEFTPLGVHSLCSTLTSPPCERSKQEAGSPLALATALAAVELWKANVPHKAIREQLDISKATLIRILAFARANADNPVPMRKPGRGLPSKFSTSTLESMKRKLNFTPTLIGLQLKKS
jgi:hypothetical protein